MTDAELTEKVETCIARLEQLPDRAAREQARETLAAVLELHRVGLARIIERLPAVQLQALATEPLVGSLLVLHELHPADLEGRVARAVEKVRPMLALNGAAVTLEVAGSDVRLVLKTGPGCGTGKLRSALEAAVNEVAPDARAVRIEETTA